MDGERHEPLDDVTVVGDHELLRELRRIAAQRAQPTGTPLPPPRPDVSPARPGPPDPLADRPAGRPTTRRDVPPEPRAVGAEWWDDDDEDGSRPMRLVLIAVVVIALAVAALLLLR